MKKVITPLFAAMMVLTFSFATLAEDKPAAEKSVAADGKKKGNKKHDKKKAEGEATKAEAGKGAKK